MWINNCIGTKNHSVFFVYIWGMFAHLWSIIILCIANLDNVVNRDLLVRNPFFAWVNQWENKNFEVTENDIIMFHLTLVLLLAMCFVFMIPLTLLVYVQLKNFLNNQTTNIRFSKFKRTTVITDISQIPKGT